jgi:hypothetical protein
MGDRISLDIWSFCMIYLWQKEKLAGKNVSGSAAIIVPDPGSVLERGMKVTLLLKNKNGEVFQVVDGTVWRRWKERNYVEVRIPWHVAVALAEWAGKKVDDSTRKLVIYDYVVQIKEVKTPPLGSSMRAT